MYSTIKSPLMATPPQQPFFLSQRTVHRLAVFKHLYNGHLSTTAKPTETCLQLPKSNLSTMASFFQPLIKKQGMVIKLDLYGTLTINHGIILCLCSIYTASVSINCLQYLFILSCLLFDSKQFLFKLFCVFYPLPPHNSHLSTIIIINN